MKNIVFCCDNNYAPFLAVTIKSILCNNTAHDCHFHIFCNDIDEVNRNRIYDVVHKSDAIVSFRNIVDDKLRSLEKRKWPINAWHRVLLPEILPNLDRVLYFDADTIVMGNLDYLFKMDISHHSIGAVIDIESFENSAYQRCGYPQELKYICSGVLLMNLAYWRANGLTDKIIKWGIENADRLKCPDQDAINHVCANDKIVLPLKYGILSTFNFKHHHDFVKNNKKECIDMLDNPIIVHYAGMQPWFYEKRNHFFREEWDKYNKMLEIPIKKRHYFHGKQLIMHWLRLWYKSIGLGTYSPQITAQPESLETIRNRFINS